MNKRKQTSSSSSANPIKAKERKTASERPVSTLKTIITNINSIQSISPFWGIQLIDESYNCFLFEDPYQTRLYNSIMFPYFHPYSHFIIFKNEAVEFEFDKSKMQLNVFSKSKQDKKRVKVYRVIFQMFIDVSFYSPSQEFINILDKQSHEYSIIKYYFASRFFSSKYQVISVTKLFIPDLFFRYRAYRSIMKYPNEQFLFYGTNKAGTELVMQHGFEPSFNAESKCFPYGNGSYFCKLSHQAHLHTFENEPTRFMFLASVLVGNVAQGSPGIYRPPLLFPDKSFELSDSTTDDVNNSSVFVTFNKLQAYPNYLIEYEQKPIL